MTSSTRLDVRVTDDARLIAALAHSGLAETAWWIAQKSGIDPEYAEQALARMADQVDDPYPLLRRIDLGSDVYEAILLEPGDE